MRKKNNSHKRSIRLKSCKRKQIIDLMSCCTTYFYTLTKTTQSNINDKELDNYTIILRIKGRKTLRGWASQFLLSSAENEFFVLVPHLSWAQLFIYRNSDKHGSVFVYCVNLSIGGSLLKLLFSALGDQDYAQYYTAYKLSSALCYFYTAGLTRAAVGMKWGSFCVCSFLWTICWSYPYTSATHKLHYLGSVTC